MGNMIGILSTVILVSTVATLIFAVGAYVLARRRRTSTEDVSDLAEEIPETTEPLRQAPPDVEKPDNLPPPAPPPPIPASPAVAAAAPTVAPAEDSKKPVFRRLTPKGEEPVAETVMDQKPGWEWE